MAIMGNKDVLLVIVMDRLSDLYKKGEIAPRYYNPGNLFKEVHIIAVNDDVIDPACLAETAGQAKLYIHNYPTGKKLFLRSLAWRPWLLKKWAANAVKLAEQINPSLVRCHGNHLNSYLAYRIKKALGIPYLVSLHINPDEDIRERTRSWREFIYGQAIKSIEKIGLVNADLVLPVYKPIVPYLERLQIKNYEVAYNVINPNCIRKKEDYSLHDSIRIISVGRQFKDKNPKNLILAVKKLPNTHLTIVGNGPYHAYLQKFVKDQGMVEKITFNEAIPNNELCRQLLDYDIFAVHSEYWEISKAVLEALLTGLPVIINKRKGQPVPEFEAGALLLVENSAEGYGKAIVQLAGDHQLREKLGRQAYAWANEKWSPERTESKFAEIYRRMILDSGRAE